MSRLPAAAAFLAAATGAATVVVSAVGLISSHRVYRDETEALADAATAQDAVDLCLVGPLLLILAAVARRGLRPAWLVLPGCAGFTAYNFAIYSFDLHFGPLFLPWVAVLGLSIFTLIAVLTSLGQMRLPAADARRPLRMTGSFVIAVALIFVMLWLREILPDLGSGRPSTSAETWRVPTNPVHVLDLSFFLPAVIVTGVLLLRRHRIGYLTATAQLMFLILTGVPILVTPLVAAVRDHDADWAAFGPVAVLTVAGVTVLIDTLHQLERAGAEPNRG